MAEFQTASRIKTMSEKPIDPDHYLTNPMVNHEAVAFREINELRFENERLKRENEQLKIKLSRMCCDA